jgi:hypothetical protein
LDWGIKYRHKLENVTKILKWLVLLDDNTILQADATVIAGLLILLTIAYALEPRSARETTGEIAISTVTRISRLVIIVVVLFSASAILVILGNIFGSYTIILAGLGKYVMIFGFGALAVGITWLLGRKATKRWIRSHKG